VSLEGSFAPSRHANIGYPGSVRFIDRDRRVARSTLPVATAAALAAWAGLHVSSRLVQQWKPPRGGYVRAGPLSARVSGAADGPSIVVLHGLVASSDYFGRAFEEAADGMRLVVPDLAGFGRSRDVVNGSFGVDEHCATLDESLAALGVLDEPVVVGGHSMGAMLALWWAARNPRLVERVVVWSPVLQASEAAARAACARLGLLERLFVLDTRLAARMCAWTCRHRRLAAAMAIATSPRLPVRVARMGVQHTWPSYVGTLTGVVLHNALERPLAELGAAGVPVTITVGADDALTDIAYARTIAERFPTCRVEVVAGTHHLPLERPEWCARQLAFSRSSRGAR